MILLKGAENFRHRIILSLLSRKSIKIEDIRVSEKEPGLKSKFFYLLDYETYFLDFVVDHLTTGSRVKIEDHGRSVLFYPGVVLGGQIDFDCGVDASIVYFLEPVLFIAPFSRHPIQLKLSGKTFGEGYISIDAFRFQHLELLKKFNCDIKTSLKIIKRCFSKSGQSLVEFRCNTVRSIKGFSFASSEKILKIRGLVATANISPQIASRMIAAIKKTLNSFCSDIYIASDHFKNSDGERYLSSYLELLDILHASSLKQSLVVFFHQTQCLKRNLPQKILL